MIFPVITSVRSIALANNTRCVSSFIVSGAFIALTYFTFKYVRQVGHRDTKRALSFWTCLWFAAFYYFISVGFSLLIRPGNAARGNLTLALFLMMTTAYWASGFARRYDAEITEAVKYFDKLIAMRRKIEAEVTE